MTKENTENQNTTEPELHTGKSEQSQLEERILGFWQENNVFEQSLELRSKSHAFTFYDGPPFATGTPHYGHILQSTVKDLIPRYKTMQGYHVERTWGWDCHGLPIEEIVEREIGSKCKRDILEYGIEKFNNRSRDSVFACEEEWRRLIPRIGRWADMDIPYKTMDQEYMESVWWVFKTIFDKGLIYEGYKPIHICPRCETTLSHNEVSDGYVDITDISVYVKFELADEPGTYLLAWTTTPWTLPGNTALAINPNIEYVMIESRAEEENKQGKYILARSLLEKLDCEYEILRDVPTQELLGQAYIPPFPYFYNNKELENHANGWRVYPADFITDTDGTGIAHMAPAFGADDYNLSIQHNLPFAQHVGMNGRFVDAVADFPNLYVKPKEEHQSTDIEIIKYLAGKNLLFAKEKIEHSYPHCWRCSTPLLNYTADSWFVAVKSFCNRTVRNNQRVNWVPEHMKNGRFGNWISGGVDWAVSRSRFWGTPLPIWQTADKSETFVIGSFTELRNMTKDNGNNYFAIRHGHSESNRDNISSLKIGGVGDNLTTTGRGQIHSVAGTVKEAGITRIISSPFHRTKETAEILAEHLGIAKSEIIFDDRLAEVDMDGAWNGRDRNDLKYHYNKIGKHHNLPDGPESYLSVRRRAFDLLHFIDKQYQNEHILIVTHRGVLDTMFDCVDGISNDRWIRDGLKHKFQNAEFKKLNFKPFPHNPDFELDIHRPYIDQVQLVSPQTGKALQRVEYVFDCWFESGSVPYAATHYPFENTTRFKSRFPADFIAEGMDQTRGWFNSLAVLGTALFDTIPFKNVLVTGTVMAGDGRKLSKRFRNYESIDDILNEYGADYLRLFLMQSPVVVGEQTNLSVRDMQVLGNKVLGRLLNTLSLYKLYPSRQHLDPRRSPYILDKWILALLCDVTQQVTRHLDAYHISSATNCLVQFIDDLSTWYVRRNRERIKGNDDGAEYARNTLLFVLRETSKLFAPITPFTAEHIWRELRNDSDPQSVHLADWPIMSSSILQKIKNILKRKNATPQILSKMKDLRKLVSKALEARAEAGIKVRQPLASITLGVQLNPEEKDILLDEINIKEVRFGQTLADGIHLDTDITDDLRAEGVVREFMRAVQNKRKEMNLSPSQNTTLQVGTNQKGEDLLNRFKNQFCNTTNTTLAFTDNDGEEFIDGEYKFVFKILI